MSEGVEHSLQEDLEKELTCAICLELYEKPVRLDCEHSFCQKCVRKLVGTDKSSSILSCPVCRSVTTLKYPGHLGVTRLPADYRLNKILEHYLAKTGGKKRDADHRDDAGGGWSAPTQDQSAFETIQVPQPCCEVLHGYLPFDLPQQRTHDMFVRWKTNLWLSPTDFTQKATLATVRMVSVPFYVFHVKTQADFKARLLCPQPGTTIPSAGKVTTSVSHAHVSEPSLIPANTDPCSSHKSRKWVQDAVGSTVLHKTKRVFDTALDINWATWLWTQSLIPGMMNRDLRGGCGADGQGGGGGRGGCSAGAVPPQPCADPLLAGAGQPPQQQQPGAPPRCSAGPSSSSGGAGHTRVDNLEINTKVGQTYVSSTQPTQRTLNLNGSHQNSFSNMLVCASFALDNDLVAALMTGNSKDEDIALLTSIKLSPPTREEDIAGYLKTIGDLVNENEGALSGIGKSRDDGTSKKKKKKPAANTNATSSSSSSKRTAASRPSASSSSAPSDAKGAPKTDAPASNAPPASIVYDELISAPNIASASLDRYSLASVAPPAAAAAAALPQPPGHKVDELTEDEGDDFAAAFASGPLFGDLPEVDAPPPPLTGLPFFGEAPTAAAPAQRPAAEPLPDHDEIFDPAADVETSAAIHIPDDVSEQEDALGSPSPAAAAKRPGAGAGQPGGGPSLTSRVLGSIAEDYFAAGAGSSPLGEDDAQGGASFAQDGVLPPERSSEQAWTEQIWPHVQEREIEFTQKVIRSMEPAGSILEEGEIELTVTELKQRAILIPCYVATYKYENRSFDVIIHGRTGEVHGKRPWMGASTYDHMKKNIEHQVFHVRHYIEQSLDNLGMAS